jgi:ribulose-phosphate 3-epimerase
MKIIPAILPHRYYDIESAVQKVQGAVSTVQIDFVDGNFALNRTWWFNNKDTERLSAILREEEGLPFWDTMNYEFDLMVSNPLEHMDTFIALGPSKIIFHAEGLNQEQIIQYFESLPEIVRQTIAFGMAIGIDTDPNAIAPYIPYINTIQCMGITNIGNQGQPFDEQVLEQVKKVRALYPEMIVSVDGGIKEEHVAALAKAGVTMFVVGSAVFQNEDIHGTIKRLKDICKEVKAQEN